MITEELKQFIKILGSKEGDNIILDAIALIGAGFVPDEFIAENFYYDYYQFYTKGVLFIFDHKYLNTVMFHFTKNEGYSLCKIKLVKEIGANSTRNDVISLLGQPSLVNDKNLNLSWIKFNYDNYSLHFEFNINTSFLQKITLQGKGDRLL